MTHLNRFNVRQNEPPGVGRKIGTTPFQSILVSKYRLLSQARAVLQLQLSVLQILVLIDALLQ